MRRPLRIRDDQAVAGIVAGILMLGALVAFLAYVNAVWVPAYVANKESSAASDVNLAMQGFADTAEDRVARQVLNRSFSRAIPLGVTGIPLLGSGRSSAELIVESAPSMNVTLGTTWILNASGALALQTHTTQYPNQTIRYALGALETNQSGSSFIDLRNVLTATRTPTGTINVTIQALNITGAPQNVGGLGIKQAVASVTLVTTTSHDPGTVRMNVTNVGAAGAWRAAINRTMAAQGISGQYSASCYSLTRTFCYPTTTNTASNVDVIFLNVANNWQSTYGVVATELRS